jgi:dihydrofolate synthase/folylpolyglutamate synthase
MNYQQTLDYLYSKLPLFTRVGAAAYKADLHNILALSAAIGNPEKQFKTVHIAGTNGKGSSSHFLASIFQEAGYKTGLFTSPHLKDFRERIRVNGKMISRQKVVRFTEKYSPLFEEIQPSFFEMTVALAFEHFANEKVDIAIIETGLGGRLDSTNIITPELSLITNISMDHTDLLGDTIVKISYEKAGIIKQGIPVVISEEQEESRAVFVDKGTNQDAQLVFASDLVSWNKEKIVFENGRNYLALTGENRYKKKEAITVKSPLTGNYQQKNIKGVLLAAEVLKERGWKITKEHILQGIYNATINTGLRGRWEQLGKKPLIICDTGHNEAGVKEVVAQLASIDYKHLHIVWGMVGDKDVSKVLSLLPTKATYYFCKANLPRAMAADVLQQMAQEKGLKGKKYSSVKRAVLAAKRAANQADMILIGGSTFVVAEAI